MTHITIKLLIFKGLIGMLINNTYVVKSPVAVLICTICIFNRIVGVLINNTKQPRLSLFLACFPVIKKIYLHYYYRVIQIDCCGIVYSCTDGSRNSQSFLLWCAVCSSYAFLPELKVRIRTAIETITADMLQTVWKELNFCVDVCRITKGAHIEHL